jgi:transcriptional regulator with XRE-family HTH domain
MKEIGAIVREHRLTKGMTMLEVATLLGYSSPQFISLFERGVSKIPLDVLGRLTVILKIPRTRLYSSLIEESSRKIKEDILKGVKHQEEQFDCL